MASNFPGGLDSFSQKTDGVDDILAAHVNALQDAIMAVEQNLGLGAQGSLTSLVTRLAVCLNADGSLKSGAFTPGAGSITNSMLAANSVGSSNLIDGSVTGTDIAAATITGSNLAAGAVGTAQMANQAVTTALLADANVTQGKIAAGNVSPDNLGLTVWNATGSALTAGQLVYVSGWNAANSLPQVTLAINNAAFAWAEYLVTATIANGASGLVRRHWLSGANLNTNGSTVGNPVYLDSVAGGWTLTPPAASASRQQIVGRVTVVSATVGQVDFDTITNATAAVRGTVDLPIDVAYLDAGNTFTALQTITPATAARCLNLNHKNSVGATVFIASNNAVDATWRTLVNFAGKYQFGTDLAFNGTADWFVQNLTTGNAVLQCGASDLLTLGSAAATGGTVLGKAGGKVAAFDGTPVIQQANASQADVTAITDTHAKAAVQAIYNLLKNYNLAPATP